MKLRTVVLTLLLPDKRILLHRKLITGQSKVQWSATREYRIQQNKDTLDSINKHLWEDFGIDANVYSDDYAQITRRKAILNCNESFIFPITVEFSGTAVWQAKKDDQYIAVSWEDLSKDILANSVYPKNGAQPKHTNITIHTLQDLHTRRIIG